jgi:diguanylate cyclase (GGDEF)-like protein
MRLERPPALRVFLMVVNTFGLGLLGLLVAVVDVRTLRAEAPAYLLLLLILAFGERQPIEIAHGDLETDEVSVSSTFGMVLLMLAPLGLAVAAQATAVLVDELRRGKPAYKVAFNVSQYTLTFTAARLVFAALSDRGFLFDATPFRVSDLVPALAGGVAFLLVNNGLLVIVMALADKRLRVLPILSDARLLVTSGLMLSLAPVVAAAISFSTWLIPLMLLPIVAVHRAAGVSIERERQALHDTLTGLPNRAMLALRMQRALSRAGRAAGPVAVMIVDLDHFKEINDTLGHHVGDELIKAVGDRLRGAIREDDTVARLGGDEFAVLAPGADRDEIVTIAERVGGALEEPFTVQGVRLDVQASIGIALSPEHGDAGDTLLQRADVALYTAKARRGCYAIYEPEDDDHTPERLALLGDLRQGIEAGELVVHYQPTCDSRTGHIVGVEALARWQHPKHGLLQPDDFIPTAENTGLIEPLTMAVLNQALADSRRWRDAGIRLDLAVNLSVRHLTNLDLPGQVADALARNGIPAHTLTLEVTESTIMADPTRAVTVLAMLRAQGISLAIDDFGTGYSSLSFLRRLDFDELKIDRSFVARMHVDEHDAVIVRSTIELGHNLGLRVVAEGVESEDIWRQLLPLGCDVVQGFHIARPMPAAELEAWLAGLPQTSVPQAITPLAPRIERTVA